MRGFSRNRVVVALGGNAILRPGETPDVATQRRHIRDAALALAPLIEDNDVVITHGNGPQVGMLAERAAHSQDVPPESLDVLNAESAGLIGYLIEQELHNVLCARPVATLLTQTLVDPDDAAFSHPTKPVGLADSAGQRRVVPSPEPHGIVELPAVEALLDAGIVVICAGGGGVPVVADALGTLTGIEGVVDKDLVSGIIAAEIGADALLLLTDVKGVYDHFGMPDAELLTDLSTHVAATMPLPEGSMGPKVSAACRFADRTGRVAVIGALEDAEAIAAGSSGTRVHARLAVAT